MSQFCTSYRDSAPFAFPPPTPYLTSFKTRAAWEASPGPLLKRPPGASRFTGGTHFPLGNLSCCLYTWLSPHHTTCFPKANSSVQDPVRWQPLPGLLCLGFCSSNLLWLLGHAGQPGSAALGSIPVSSASRAPMHLVSEHSSAAPVILKAWPAPSA